MSFIETDYGLVRKDAITCADGYDDKRRLNNTNCLQKKQKALPRFLSRECGL